MTKQFVLKPGQNDKGWENLTNFLAQNESKPMTVNIRDGLPENRSMSANALQAVWIREIAEFQGDSEHNVRLWVKCALALPVMRYNVETKDEQDRAARINFTLNRIGYNQMTTIQQIRVAEMFDVTSVMSRRQHKVFCDQMQRHYAQIGIHLKSSSDDS